MILAAAAPGEFAAQSKESANSSGPAVDVRADVGWLGLYTDRLAHWTENGNQLRFLCGKFKPESREYERCRDEHLRPIQQTATVRTGPGREAPAAGTIVMTASGAGLSTAWLPANGSAPIDFSPDFDNWNCSYFHHSYRERRGDWFRLGEGPWPRDTWVDWNELAGESGHRRLEREDIVESPWGNIVILGVGARFMRFRAEQERDMWVGADEPQPPVASFKERRVPISDLFTATGKMRLKVRYACGC
jgi:hypothetical protein